jgi:hypothetical protein
MPHAFKDSLHRRSEVDLLFNHRSDRKLGSTSNNLTLFEDTIGLRATCVVDDPEVVQKARNGELRGWSFGFIATEQRWEGLENGMERRFVDGLDLLEVSILDCTPAYVATTLEARGEDTVVSEQRFEEFNGEFREEKPEEVPDNEDKPEEEEKRVDYSVIETEILIQKLKGR